MSQEGVAKGSPFQSHFFAGSNTRIFSQTLFEDKDGFLWLGTKQGLYMYDGHDPVLFPSIDTLSNPSITSICQGPDGAIWVGHQSGEISYLDGQSLVPVAWEEGHPDVKITGLLFDPSGVLWISTYGEGLYYWKNNRLYNINMDDGLVSDELYCMVMDSEGNVWLGSDQGINICALSSGQKNIQPFSKADQLPDQIVQSLYFDASGLLWIGTYESGLARYNPSDGSLKSVP